MNWKKIKICGKCGSIDRYCKCNFGTYKAGYVYKSFFDFLKSMIRMHKIVVSISIRR